MMDTVSEANRQKCRSAKISHRATQSDISGSSEDNLLAQSLITTSTMAAGRTDESETTHRAITQWGQYHRQADLVRGGAFLRSQTRSRSSVGVWCSTLVA
jgi:hypothetical protein